MHLMDLAEGVNDKAGVSFLSLPLEARRSAAEISAKVKEQMGLFGTVTDD